MTRRESKPSSESPDKAADNPYLMATMAEDTAFGLSRIGQISVNVHDLDRAADRWNKPLFRAGDRLRIPCIVSDLGDSVHFRLHRGGRSAFSGSRTAAGTRQPPGPPIWSTRADRRAAIAPGLQTSPSDAGSAHRATPSTL